MLVFLKYFSLLILLFVGILFGFIMLVRFIRLSDIIKGRNLGKYFASLIYLIKVLTVLAIIPVVDVQATSIFESIQQLKTLSDTEHYFENIYSIRGFKILIRDKEYFFPELGNDTENPEYLKHLEMLKDYQDLNAFYMREEWIMIDRRDESRDFFPMVIDSNYLKHDLGLHDFEKDVNDLLKENDIVILYDETTEADKIEAVIKRYTEKKVKEVTITMPNNVFVIDKEIPEIVIVMKSDVDRIDKTIFNNMYFYDIDKDVIERVAKKYDFEDMFDIVDYKEHVKDRKSNIITPLMKDMLHLLMSLAVLLTIAYSFFIAYKRTKLQTINVQKLLGYPIWYIYFDYVLESVLSYVLLFILHRDKFYSYMKYIIVIELLIFGIIYIQNKYQKIHIELKKEEI